MQPNQMCANINNITVITIVINRSLLHTTTRLPLVRKKSGKFKVREKSGNFEIGQGILEICEKSGKFGKIALESGKFVLLFDKCTINVNTTLCKFIEFIQSE